jgi:hypothetical protein
MSCSHPPWPPYQELLHAIEKEAGPQVLAFLRVFRQKQWIAKFSRSITLPQVQSIAMSFILTVNLMIPMLLQIAGT